MSMRPYLPSCVSTDVEKHSRVRCWQVRHKLTLLAWLNWEHGARDRRAAQLPKWGWGWRWDMLYPFTPECPALWNSAPVWSDTCDSGYCCGLWKMGLKAKQLICGLGWDLEHDRELLPLCRSAVYLAIFQQTCQFWFFELTLWTFLL